MPKVSVIIPTYNSARFLPEAIESVLKQTFQDLEIIVVDDGSTDNTGEVVAPYLDRITFSEIPNGGPARARNRAIRESSGEYVAFLDADDIWYPHKLERQMGVFSSNRQYGLVHGDASLKNRTWFSNKKSRKTGWVFSELLENCFIILSSVVVKRDCLEKAGLFNKDFVPWEGYDLWLRIASGNQIGVVNAPLLLRRIHDSNLFFSSPLDEVTSLIAVLKQWDNAAGANRSTINRRLKNQYSRLSLNCSARGLHSQARQALRESFARGLSPKGLACLGLSMLPTFALRYLLKGRQV
jgi:glycosyltransferase involved in cell wall biosynthesis